MRLGTCLFHGNCVEFDHDDALLRYGCRLCREGEEKRQRGLTETVETILIEENVSSNVLAKEKEKWAALSRCSFTSNGHARTVQRGFYSIKIDAYCYTRKSSI